MKLPAVVTEGFLQSLPPAERKRLGRAGITQAEAEATFQAGEERKLQGLISNWLHLHNIYFVRPRMDRKSTTPLGTPDFIICAPPGAFLGAEVKCTRGTLSAEQAKAGALIRASGGRFIVARCLQDVIDAIDDLNAE